MKKRILVISYYFSPDLSACAFRTASLVKAISRNYPDIIIDVVTTYPSRYTSYKPDALFYEQLDNVNVYRFAVPDLNIGLKGEILSTGVFFYKVWRFTNSRDYQAIYATSAKLFTAVFGGFLSDKGRIPLYLDLRDLFIENVQDMFSISLKRLLLCPLRLCERYALSRAAKVNLVSKGFEPHFNDKILPNKLSFYTNGIDPEIFSNTPIFYKKTNNNLVHLLYVGNIGRAQRLEEIVPKIAKKMGGRIRFTIVGDGRGRNKLIQKITQLKLKNVEVLPPVAREKLVYFFREADILFLHLDNCESLSKVIPSKVFEYAFTGLPILCGVSGYTRQFIEENILNATCFMPKSVEDAVQGIESLDFDLVDRSIFIKKYDRHAIMDDMSRDLISLT